jgi:hypothetical protein
MNEILRFIPPKFRSPHYRTQELSIAQLWNNYNSAPALWINDKLIPINSKLIPMDSKLILINFKLVSN